MNNDYNAFPSNSYDNRFDNFSRNQSYSNIVLVTSLEEAIMRTTRPGSDMVYFNQSGGEFYRVKMDWNGAKYHQTFPYSMPDSSSNEPVTKGDYEKLVARLEALEKFIPKEAPNEQSSG